MADITTKSVVSEYSSELALACRTNPDGSMPFNKNFILEFENADGSTEERRVIGGIYGKLGAVDISGIASGTGEYLHFIELDKEDKVAIDLSDVSTPTTAALADIATALNADLNDITNFPNIGHGFHAEVLKNRLFVSADIPVVVTGIPTFVDGSYTFSDTSLAVTVKEGVLTADNVTVSTTNGVMTISDFLTSLNTALGSKTWTNSGHAFVGSIENGQIVIKSVLAIPYMAPLEIRNSVDGDGDVDSEAASVLELSKSYWRAIRNMASLTAAANTSDPETINNEDGVGIVTSVTTAQSVTGMTLNLEDAERNPITNVILCGGRYDSTRGTYTPKKPGVNPPTFGLLCFSKVFQEGNFGIEANAYESIVLYPSNTAVKNNNDKAQKDFNHDTYDITASDSAYVPAEVTMVVDKDTADKYLAFAELL